MSSFQALAWTGFKAAIGTWRRHLPWQTGCLTSKNLGNVKQIFGLSPLPCKNICNCLFLHYCDDIGSATVPNHSCAAHILVNILLWKQHSVTLATQEEPHCSNNYSANIVEEDVVDQSQQKVRAGMKKNQFVTLYMHCSFFPEFRGIGRS